ncbi:hypothetical protein [Spongorhabdus nitratireducens]
MASINSTGSIVPSPSEQIDGVQPINPIHKQDEGQEHFSELMEKKQDHDKTQEKQAKLEGDEAEISPDELHKQIMDNFVKKQIQKQKERMDEMRKDMES